MKKTFAIFALSMILVLTFGFAAGKVGSPDEECIANGFNYGIVKYECDGDDIVNGSHASDYDIDFNWTKVADDKGKMECIAADWTADPAIYGFVSKEGDSSFFQYFEDGETSGTITKSDQNSISHITFCGNYEPPVVPEFGTIVGVLTVLSALGTFFVVRRK